MTEEERLADMLEDDALTTAIGRREHIDYRIDAAFALRSAARRLEVAQRMADALMCIYDHHKAETMAKARAALAAWEATR